jgi:hypothetical protein
MILATANLYNRFKAGQQSFQVKDIAGTAQVIVVQEATGEVAAIAPEHWEGQQFYRKPGEPSGEAVMWGPDVRVLETGGRWACGPDSAGLSKRFYPWADVATEAGVVCVIDAHRPPRRNTLLARLGPGADFRLRRVIRRARRRGRMWAVGGDWNQRITTDPAGLRAKFGAVWLGHRIDGWAVCPLLDKHISHVTVDPDGRADDHDVVYLTITKEKS